MKPLVPSNSRPEIDLDGAWSFALDPADEGLEKRWFDRDLDGSIQVPGSWEEQGFGERPAEFIGGWTKRRSYEGVGWYSRSVTVPAEWEGNQVRLELGRVGWRSSVFVDDHEIGTRDSLSTPHGYDLTRHVQPGATHRLTIRVDNAVQGVLNYEGHIHSRHTATAWGGIVGHVRLIAVPRTWIDDLAIYPDAAGRSVRTVVRLGGEASDDTTTVTIHAGQTEIARVDTQAQQGVVDTTIELGPEARLWSDDDPFLHDITVTLGSGDAVHERFGLRTFGADGQQLTLNGEPIYLRGYVDCCIFPLTGYPPEDKAEYERQFAIAKEWGFNHVRLHSWTPSRVFFEAADEAGMLVQTELPVWDNGNADAFVGRALPFMRAELDRIVRHLQRHPSMVIVSMGNEMLQLPRPGGAGFRHSPSLNELVHRGRELDPTRLYTDQTGFGNVPEDDERESDVFVLHTFRGSTPDTTSTWEAKIAGAKSPIIAHEHTQMDMYARLEEIDKFTGIMEPSWLLQARQTLESKGLLVDTPRYVEASAALQKQCLKELFERLRRTPGVSGVQMLNFTDFPGQGSALNGVLDVFWDSKGHVTPEEFRQFNGSTVLLCKSATRTYGGGGYLNAELLVSKPGRAKSAPGGDLEWTLTADDGAVIASGSEPHVSVRLPHATSQRLTLSASVGDVANAWDFWVVDDRRSELPEDVSIRVRPNLTWLADYYPSMKVDEYSFMSGSREADPSRQLMISDRLHVRYLDVVLNGGTMIWFAEDDDLLDGVQSTFESLFWSFLWFPEQDNQTMGLVVRDHPALGAFPHDGNSDWQWFHLVDGATAIGLDALPGVQPIVEGVDNWSRAKRLGYLFEVKLGRGRILVTTLKVLDGYRSRPEAVALVDSMLRYAGSVASPATAPASSEPVELSIGQVVSIPRNPVGYSR